MYKLPSVLLGRCDHGMCVCTVVYWLEITKGLNLMVRVVCTGSLFHPFSIIAPNPQALVE